MFGVDHDLIATLDGARAVGFDGGFGRGLEKSLNEVETKDGLRNGHWSDGEWNVGFRVSDCLSRMVVMWGYSRGIG